MSEPFQGQSVDSYLDGPRRQVPGFDGLLKMTTMLLAERVPESGNILVFGAGGGLETRAMAQAYSGWRFDGVDPSQDMLDLASRTVAPYSDRVNMHLGYIDSAPIGPYDGATCLLTMHFVPQEQRLHTLTQIRERLKPGAPLVMAHISFPQTEPERSTWIAGHVAYADTAPERVEFAQKAIGERLTILSPADEESMLNEAGFSGITLFYAGLSLRGWVAYAR